MTNANLPACDECGAGPGQQCEPFCTAPVGPGGPHEHDDLRQVESDLARTCPVCGSQPGEECAPGFNCGYLILTRPEYAEHRS